MARHPKRYQAPVGSYFCERSHCHWIESAGIEDTAPLAPLSGDQAADIVIVGGGYTGLSAALHLAEAFPERRIVLLEGTRIGYGASGRNCGLVLPFINGCCAQHLAFDGTGIWLTNNTDSSISKMDPDTGARVDYDGPSSDGLAYDGQSLWIANFADDTVTKMNP